MHHSCLTSVNILTFTSNYFTFFVTSYWKLFTLALWDDGMLYQGVSMAIRVMCQGPLSSGLQRSRQISRMKKSAFWRTMPSQFFFTLPTDLTLLQTSPATHSAHPHPSSFVLKHLHAVILHPAIYTLSRHVTALSLNFSLF